jgi:hypothetical protein
MFINCPFCKALVATDPATDLPPEQCPRCTARLREATAEAAATPAPEIPAGHPLDVPAPEPGAAAIEAAGAPSPSELSSRIHGIVAGEPAEPAPSIVVAPIATLLKAAAPAEATPEPPPVGATEVATGEADEAQVATSVAPTGDVAAPAAREELAAEAAPTRTPGPAVAAAPPARASAVTAPSTAATATTPAKPMPSFARRHAAGTHAGFRWKTGAVIAALALVLLLQLLLADRARLAADARWRPLVSTLCGALGCSLPPWREPSAFTVLQRDVRPHPATPGALRVTATFRNDARWPQPWPRLRLTLSDVDGRAVAMRDFAASDYLGSAPAQAELGSGQSASIAMDIAEPARRSVAFDFELH